MGAFKRIQQGIRALLAFTRTVDYDTARRWLTPQEMQLFRNLGRSEQLHSLNVLRDVLAQEAHTPPELAAAALLHDAGKGRYRLAVWQKTLSVLVKTLHPTLEKRLRQDGDLTFWRAPFIVRYHHPKWSGEMLRAIGSDERVIWLAQHHADAPHVWQDHPDYSLLRRLQQADDMN